MQKLQDKNIYEVTLSNKGGLVMPVIIEWTYKDGTKEIERIPAEIWRVNEHKVTKVFVKEKEVTNVVLDPNRKSQISIWRIMFSRRLSKNPKVRGVQEKTKITFKWYLRGINPVPKRTKERTIVSQIF